MNTLLGVSLSIAVVYIFFKGLLCVTFDLSNYFVNRLEGSERPESEKPESSVSSTAKALVFWVAVLLLGVLVWKLIERFALEPAFFKATEAAVGLCVLGLAVMFFRWFRSRTTEQARTKFRG